MASMGDMPQKTRNEYSFKKTDDYRGSDKYKQLIIQTGFPQTDSYLKNQ